MGARQPREGLEQLALPFEGQKLYYGYCAICWGDELIDGPHLVGLCQRCRYQKDNPVPWEESEAACLRNEYGYASFDAEGWCYYCDRLKEDHENVQG